MNKKEEKIVTIITFAIAIVIAIYIGIKGTFGDMVCLIWGFFLINYFFIGPIIKSYNIDSLADSKNRFSK